MTITIPLALKAALETGECVLFIGAGIGEHLTDHNGRSLPTGAELAEELCALYKIDPVSQELPKVAKIVELRKGRAELEAFLRKRLAGVNPDANLQWLGTIRWRAIYTTNYDYGIPRIYELNPNPPQRAITISVASDLVEIDSRFDVPIFYLHGALFGGHERVLITADDYATFNSRRHMLFERLKLSCASSPILYVGYSNKDTNWTSIQAEIAEEFFPEKTPHSYRIDPYSDPLDIEILKDKNIYTISSRFDDFVETAIAELKDFRTEHDSYRKQQKLIPLDLIGSFNSNPVATSRLVAAWHYVNQVNFSDRPNIESFLLGDRPNWSLIDTHGYFERDIFEESFDTLLDYATSSTKTVKNLLVLGSAGYGITTQLMALAVGLVREGVQPVFYIKQTAPITEGDIEFAISQFKNPPFFFIDDASDHVEGLSNIILRLKQSGLVAHFVLGDRKNEWLNARAKFSVKRFDIEPLSDGEVDRLIDYLSDHRALNKLEGLDRGIQHSEIKNRNARELLVAMREATEGTGFDAIIESEYLAIQNETLQRMYLATCCMHQFGAFIRDGALANVLGLGLTEMYSLNRLEVDGVIHFEIIDEANGIYAARSRQRIIAQIVWERCADNALKDKVLLASIQALNLTFRSDRKAFEELVRSERLIDGIKSLDQRIQFFESACRKDPENQYVRQHFSRMLLRAGELASALAQINEGIQINSRKVPKVLYHTQGIILSELAHRADSLEIGRRYMAKAEQSFNRLISLNEKDDFSYQGLASIYLMWARKVDDEKEAAIYIAKAEEQISTGLRLCKNKDSLWITSSDIHKYLGHEPSRIVALERAVKEAPASVVARYLLARSYRETEKYDDAISILQPVITNNPDEYRSFMEYALATYEGGKDIKLAANIMALSRLYGYSDIRYLAIHAGLLFLDGRAVESYRVFKDGERKDFGSGELNKIHFVPKRLGQPITFSGKIVSVKTQMSLIEVPGLESIPFYSSKTNGVVLNKGMSVTFELAFSGRSPIARSIIDIAVTTNPQQAMF